MLDQRFPLLYFNLLNQYISLAFQRMCLFHYLTFQMADCSFHDVATYSSQTLSQQIGQDAHVCNFIIHLIIIMLHRMNLYNGYTLSIHKDDWSGNFEQWADGGNKLVCWCPVTPSSCCPSFSCLLPEQKEWGLSVVKMEQKGITSTCLLPMLFHKWTGTLFVLEIIFCYFFQAVLFKIHFRSSY